MSSYKLFEKLGEGSFADVFRANGRAGEVAIKMLREFRDHDARHRFERECRMLASYTHPAVVRVVDANLQAERPWFAMPCMKGGTLQKYVGKLNVLQVRCLARSLTSVLVYLHDRGALHRDLKPENVLVDGEGHCYVGDFGLGNDPGCTVAFTRGAAGTPGYAAPELAIVGATATTASDVYSLGATLFHAATGVHPGKATNLDGELVRVGLPNDLRYGILRMLARQSRQRPSAKDALGYVGGVHDQPAKVPISNVWNEIAVAALATFVGVGLVAAFSKG